jgi:hypothetical protein
MKEMERFLKDLEEQYLANPFHNAIHGADVLSSMFWLIENTSLYRSLNYIDLLACFISSLGHDVGHLGKTNRFLVATNHEIAIRYNDISVQENMHTSIIWEILRRKECDILRGLTNVDWQIIRKSVIELILCTDM